MCGVVCGSILPYGVIVLWCSGAWCGTMWEQAEIHGNLLVHLWRLTMCGVGFSDGICDVCFVGRGVV